MCFSATASFSAGVVLTVIGIATLKKVQHPSQIMFASIPLIFAVQQITEGVLWLALPSTAYPAIQVSFTYIFLFFAQVVWLLWVPLAILLLEKKGKGFPVYKKEGETGDLYVTYEIKLPAGLTAQQKTLFTELSKLQ